MYDDSDETKGSQPMYSGKWWVSQIEEAEKDLDEKLWGRAKTVIERYTDDRNDDPNNGVSRYNMFWANTQILKSALYAVPPKPTVMRENADSKDDVARTAAMMLERILQQGMTKSRSDSHESIKAAVEDRLLPGLGQVWVRYESEIEKFSLPAPIDPATGLPMGPDIQGERVVTEKVCTDYVNWRDFLWSPARRWNDVWWVARRVWMKKHKFIKRFGEGSEEKWKQIREEAGENSRNNEMLPKGFRKNRAEVFEIWCEPTAKVYFVCKSLDEVIERAADPLGLEEFFPCPKPLLATHTNESLIPTPDYCMVQDQYEELDTLNNRISVLTKALRVVGAYDSGNPELSKMLTGPELAMVPVENWAALGEKGGMAKAVDWFPVEVIAKVLAELTAQRAQVVGQIYELTSISDIMRGASNPRETAKAQQLKAQYSSVRLQLTQQDVASFVQDVLRLKAEIVCKHFQPETIKKQSQVEFSESAPLADAAIQLLKEFEAAEYRIDVSEESLSMADYNAERQMRIELITAVGQFFSQSAQMVQSQPGALPYMLQIVQWVVASFRGSKDVESILDQAVEAAKKAPPASEEKQKPDHSIEVANINSQTAVTVANIKAAADKEIAGIKDSAEKVRSEVDRRLKEEKILMDYEGEMKKAIDEVKSTSEAETEKSEESAESAALLRSITTLEEANKGTQKLLMDLLDATLKPRRKTPHRNSEGDIVYIDEEIKV